MSAQSAKPRFPVRKALSNDRRTFVRFHHQAEASCFSGNRATKGRWPAVQLDISTGGVGLLVLQRFEPGALLDVTLQDSSGTFRRFKLARVVRVDEENPGQPDDGWRLGCEFSRPLTEEELQALMK